MPHAPESVLGAVTLRWGDGRSPEILGRGMEGVVIGLDDHRVAKVWSHGDPDRLQRVRTVLGAVPDLPFELPRIEAVDAVDGWVVTVERRLRGTPLAELLATGAIDPAAAMQRVVDVVAALAAAGDVPAARELPVLDEDRSLYVAPGDFTAALGGLVHRRVDRFAARLAAALPDLDRVVAALVTRLPEVDSGARALVHGDLFPGNVLVDPDGRVSAVLDWGFLTTRGDPVFEAAVAAALFDMYSDTAPATERAMRELVHTALGHDRDALLVFRAAYSLVTANAYSEDGSDGHFAWCVAGLRRPDVRSALGV